MFYALFMSIKFVLKCLKRKIVTQIFKNLKSEFIKFNYEILPDLPD